MNSLFMKNFFIISSFLLILFITNIANSQTGWFWQYPYPQGNELYDIQFVSKDTALAVGYNGTVIKTINGGINWSLLNFGNKLSTDLNTLYFINSQTGFVGGNNLFKTTNGGINWYSLSFTGNIKKIYFINDSTGFLSSGGSNKIFKTTNSGINWSVVLENWHVTCINFKYY